MPAAPLPGIMSASPSDNGKREQAVHRLFARVADQRSGMDCGGAAEPRPGGDRPQQQRPSLSRLLSHVASSTTTATTAGRQHHPSVSCSPQIEQQQQRWDNSPAYCQLLSLGL